MFKSRSATPKKRFSFGFSGVVVGRALAEDVKLASLIFLCFLCLLLVFNHLPFPRTFWRDYFRWGNSLTFLAFTFWVVTARVYFLFDRLHYIWYPVFYSHPDRLWSIMSGSFPRYPVLFISYLWTWVVAFGLSGPVSVLDSQIRGVCVDFPNYSIWNGLTKNRRMMLTNSWFTKFENRRQEPFLHWFS